MALAPDAPHRLDSGLTAALHHEISRHARLLHVLKNQMAALVPAGLDVAAFTLLVTLVRCGPKRQGELADDSFLDPSTVSRHVAQLVRASYVQRRPHPQDGRAVQLVATADGVRVAEHIVERRQAVIADALAGWEPGDVRSLVTLLARLNDGLSTLRPQLARPAADPAPGAPPTTSVPRHHEQEIA